MNFICNLSRSGFWLFSLVVLSLLTDAVYSQTSTGGQVGGAAIKSALPVPSYGHFVPIVNEQADLIPLLFCIPSNNVLWVFDMDTSPMNGVMVQGVSEGTEVGVWTPKIVQEADWYDLFTSGDISADQFVDLLNSDSHAALMLGELSGTCGSRYILAIGLTRTGENGEELNYLIPIKEVPELIADILPEVIFDGIGVIIADCDVCDWGCCDQQRRLDVKAGLNSFTRCQAANSPPISWKNLACFVGCTPALVGTPLVYAACTVACNAIVSADSVIDTSVCMMDLENAIANSDSVYCSCRAYQESNCPSGAEPDVGGRCP